MYLSGQGKVYLATRNAQGVPGAMVFLGNTPNLELNLEIDNMEHIESYTGNRARDARIIKTKKGTVSMSMEDFNLDNLALALYGKQVTVAGSSVVDEVLPNTMVVGSRYLLANQKVSSLVIKDSSATPKTLTSGTNYSASADDLVYGAFTVLDLTTPVGIVQPLKASYSYGARTDMALFTEQIPERYLRFEGINTVDSSKVMLELYKLSFDPAGLSMINDDWNKQDLKAELLVDTTKPTSNALGQFGKIVLL
ncbi:phage tail tube protein [Desulforegula conservatrix]|uniref:phage tail tube protein n=1 Tax=Desulforegula conservatrix TaxID=153026 RepID=UPI00040B0B08|nr:hypothetical protein [Desulforegula conservatrix]